MARASYGFSTLFETMAQIRRDEKESDIINDFAAGLMEYSVLDAVASGLVDMDPAAIATGPDDVADEIEGDSRLESLISKIPEDDGVSVSESLLVDFDKDVEAYMVGL